MKSQPTTFSSLSSSSPLLSGSFFRLHVKLQTFTLLNHCEMMWIILLIITKPVLLVPSVPPMHMLLYVSYTTEIQPPVELNFTEANFFVNLLPPVHKWCSQEPGHDTLTGPAGQDAAVHPGPASDGWCRAALDRDASAAQEGSSFHPHRGGQRGLAGRSNVPRDVHWHWYASLPGLPLDHELQPVTLTCSCSVNKSAFQDNVIMSLKHGDV